MASMWQKALLYLGLVDEEQYEEEPAHPPERPQARPQARPTRPRPQQAQQPPIHRPTANLDAASVQTIPAASAGGSRRVEPPGPSRWRPANSEARLEEVGSVRPVVNIDTQVEIVVAYEFSDAQLLADHLRDRRPVVLDLRDVEPEMVRRLVDFASGITYALDGTMQKVARGVILVSPPRVTLNREERRRLASLGLYDEEAT